MRITRWGLMAAVLLLSSLLVACAAGGQAQPPGAAGDGAITDYNSFVAAVEGRGATVEPAGEIVPGDSVFPVGTRIVEVNGEAVQLFEFADPAAAQAAADTVEAGGTIVGTATYEWIATPHFYRAGNLIALYVGDDAATLSLLDDVLGEQFAGGAPAFTPGS